MLSSHTSSFSPFPSPTPTPTKKPTIQAATNPTNHLPLLSYPSRSHCSPYFLPLHNYYLIFKCQISRNNPFRITLYVQPKKVKNKKEEITEIEAFRSIKTTKNIPSIMDIEKPRRTSSNPTTRSELFICFTPRLSNSSSMRLSSKSILSPGRAADKSAASLSLSTSLSRRLGHNDSHRGAQSPAMFPSKKSRGGSGFDNPEPSSPKVTCIGQVRVKTKEQGKKMKMKARRSKRLSGGEASFRRLEHAHEGLMHQNSQAIQTQQPDCGLNHRNQRWVHLPLTICDALRAFGAEFSYLLPCKSSCFSSCGGGREREKGKEREGAKSGGSCGAVFRWLVALQEGEVDGKEKDIELVVCEEALQREGRERMVMGMECSSRRRSIFDDMEIKDEIFDVKNDGQEDEAARVSICIPPKNALLLMRCRSDPAKMSTLFHKIWEAPVAHSDDGEEEDYDEDEEEEEKRYVKGGAVLNEMQEKTDEVGGKSDKLGEGGEEIDEMCADWVVTDANAEGHEMGAEDLATSAEEKKNKIEEDQDEDEAEEKQSAEHRGKAKQLADFTPEEESPFMEDEDEPNRFSIDAITIRKMFEEGTKDQDWVTSIKKETEREEISDFSSSSSLSSSSAEESTAESKETQSEEEENDKEFVKSMEKQDEEEKPPLEGQQELTHQRSEAIPTETLQEERENYPKWEEEGEEEDERENTEPVLPDCLLLMMCDPNEGL